MGNIHSADDVYKFKREALKKVYGINRSGLTELRTKLRDARGQNPELSDLLHNIELQRILVNELRQEQNKLQGRIPWDKFNLVNTFLTEVAMDINTFVPNSSSSTRGYTSRTTMPQPQQQPQQQQRVNNHNPSRDMGNEFLRSIQEEDPARLLGLTKNYDLGDVKSAYVNWH